MHSLREVGRRNLHAGLVGLSGAGLAWIAAYLGPDQMLCIETRTLALLGAGLGIVSRVWGLVLRKAK